MSIFHPRSLLSTIAVIVLHKHNDASAGVHEKAYKLPGLMGSPGEQLNSVTIVVPFWMIGKFFVTMCANCPSATVDPVIGHSEESKLFNILI